MAFGYEFLMEILSRKQESAAGVASILGISPQAISGWKGSDSIPAKRALQIARHFNLDGKDLDRLLGNEPLDFEFRTRRHEEKEAAEACPKMRVRTETIFERFFGSNTYNDNYDLHPLREQIKDANDDFMEIARLIRTKFVIADYNPLTNENLNFILERIGVKSFFMPFKAIGLWESGQSEQTAVLFKKNGKYSILIDSDRTIDEAHFDKLHEFIHVIFDTLKVSDPALEVLIDKVCGELIYPKQFILEKFFAGDETSRAVRDRENLSRTFVELNRSLKLIHSPKGLALAMRDAELTTSGALLFKFLSNELHQTHRASMSHRTYSKLGKMDFDFSDRSRLLEFYELSERGELGYEYPLFEKLKSDLMNGNLSPADFADTFRMKMSDAIVIAALWTSGNNDASK